MKVVIAHERHPLRPAAEAAVRRVYQREYGAVVRSLPPVLVAGLDGTGDVMCAAGLRAAPYLSESYLPVPVEALLARAGGRPVARERVIEVCSLAAPRPGSAIALVRTVVDLCRVAGYDWAIFTTTDRLRVLLKRSGLPLLLLGPAERGRLPSAADWGTYYEHDPQVCAVHRTVAQLGRAATRAHRTVSRA